MSSFRPTNRGNQIHEAHQALTPYFVLKNPFIYNVVFSFGGVRMPIPEELKLTYDDYLNLPDNGNRHEIIDGEHFVTPSLQFQRSRV